MPVRSGSSGVFRRACASYCPGRAQLADCRRGIGRPAHPYDRLVVATPVFYYDFNSPYAYLAAHRVDQVLGVHPRWQPIAFAFLLRATGRVPWSLTDARAEGVRICEERARRYGLPALQWPPGWPVQSHSLSPLRAALVAEEHGRLREFSLAAFAENFVHGRGLQSLDAILHAAGVAGVDGAAIRAGIERDEIKERLREATDIAVALGVVGVPTVLVDGEPYWGDDHLEAAARRTAG
jgi:2-hydroxychromene-2-carboxylate isomerase